MGPDHFRPLSYPFRSLYNSTFYSSRHLPGRLGPQVPCDGRERDAWPYVPETEVRPRQAIEGRLWFCCSSSETTFKLGYVHPLP